MAAIEEHEDGLQHRVGIAPYNDAGEVDHLLAALGEFVATR